MTIQLPAAYRAFINAYGLFEGFSSLADAEHYVILWSEDEVASAHKEMEVSTYAPGFIPFAGNGGGEIYASDQCDAVFMLPMIGMEPKVAIKVSADFLEFSRGFQR